MSEEKKAEVPYEVELEKKIKRGMLALPEKKRNAYKVLTEKEELTDFEEEMKKKLESDAFEKDESENGIFADVRPVPSPDPSYDSKDDEKLFYDVRNFLDRYVAFPTQDNLNLTTAWAFSTWFMEEYSKFPYLYLTGKSGSGKSVVLQALREVTKRGFYIEGSTRPAIVWNLCDQKKPTLLVNEIGEKLNDVNGDWFDIFRSGAEKGGKKWKYNSDVTGAESYFVYGFKGWSSIREPIQEEASNRCVILNMLPAVRVKGQPRKGFPNEAVRAVAIQQGYDLRKRLSAYHDYHIKDFKATLDTWEKNFDEINLDPNRPQDLITPFVTAIPQSVAEELVHTFSSEIGQQTVERMMESLDRKYVQAVAKVWFSVEHKGELITYDDLRMAFKSLDMTVPDSKIPGSRGFGKYLKPLGFETSVQVTSQRQGIRVDHASLLKLMAHMQISIPTQKYGENGENGENGNGERV